MQPALILCLLALLFLAHGAPVVAKRILRRRFSFPLDGGVRFVDGRPLLGPSKTIRGVVLAVAVSSASAPLLGLDWTVGALFGCAAMAGDLFSSFLKRRIGLPSSSKATGLDQVPESLFPVLAVSGVLSLSVADIAACVVAFFLGEVLLSRLLFKLRIRDHPY